MLAEPRASLKIASLTAATAGIFWLPSSLISAGHLQGAPSFTTGQAWALLGSVLWSGRSEILQRLRSSWQGRLLLLILVAMLGRAVLPLADRDCSPNPGHVAVGSQCSTEDAE